MPPKKSASANADPADSAVTNSPATPENAIASQLASYKANDKRLQPGNCETDAATGQRVIHPAANPQQVNPIHDEEHEAAAVAEAKVLLDPKASHRDKIEASAESNEAEGAPSATAVKNQEQAQKDDAKHNQEVAARFDATRERLKSAHKKQQSAK